jgi:hypothetical protein
MPQLLLAITPINFYLPCGQYSSMHTFQCVQHSNSMLHPPLHKPVACVRTARRNTLLTAVLRPVSAPDTTPRHSCPCNLGFCPSVA